MQENVSVQEDMHFLKISNCQSLIDAIEGFEFNFFLRLIASLVQY